MNTIAPFKRHVYIGKADTGYRTRALVHVDIEWTGTRLSISGGAQRPQNHDFDMGGQIQDTVRTIKPDALAISGADRDRLVTEWAAWHLNDMRAGCEHQRAEGWDKRPIDPTKPTQTYGLHFEGQTSPSWNLLGWIRPDEHPDGLLTKACPTCGYRYGTAWQTEAVPVDVLVWLSTFGEG